MQLGDIVQVHQAYLDGIEVRDSWVNAQIVQMPNNGCLGVRFVEKPTQMLMLNLGDRGQIWR